jgi:uncharacterized membrane protein (UPF0136 family)
MKGLANAGQWLGLLVFVAAIVVLVIQTQGVGGEVLVASGSFLFTVATKVKYYKDRRPIRRLVLLNELFWTSGGLKHGTRKGNEKYRT